MYLADVVAEVDAECRKRSIPMLGPEKASRLAELILEVIAHRAGPGTLQGRTQEET